MGRSSQRQRLALWMNGLPVGLWEHGRSGDQLTYFDSWINDPQGRPLSLSLPFMPGNPALGSPAVIRFFDNLLPDSPEIRRRLSLQHGLAGQDAFTLLARLGRDCAGAIQLLPEGEDPADIHTVQARPLSEADIARRLRTLTSQPFVGQAARAPRPPKSTSRKVVRASNRSWTFCLAQPSRL